MSFKIDCIFSRILSILTFGPVDASKVKMNTKKPVPPRARRTAFFLRATTNNVKKTEFDPKNQ